MQFPCCLILIFALWPAAVQAALDDYLDRPRARSECVDPLTPERSSPCMQLDRAPDPDAERRRFAGGRLREARRLIAEREAERALGAIEDVLAAYPDQWFALHIRAHARRQLGDLAGALADLERALQAGHMADAILADRCAVRFRMGDLAGARQDCATARGGPFRAMPDSYALLVHAAVAVAMGELEDAERSIAMMLRSAAPPSFREAPALRLRGWVYTLRGDAAAATQAIDAANRAARGVDADLAELLGVAPPAAPPLPPPATPARRR